MDNISNLFAPIMVIGTIMALIFAAGALWNSIARRRLLEQADRDADGEERIKFKPMPDAPAKHEKKAPTSTSSETPLFRQIGPTGMAKDEPASEENGLYVWE